VHGLINRSIQNFVTIGYGQARWMQVVEVANLDFSEFEAMLLYDDALTPRVLDAVVQVLELPLEQVMEDIGTFLVAHPKSEAVRRLLRFGGVSFQDFLYSLDDLPARARLAVPDLNLPKLELRSHAEGQFTLMCDTPIAGFGHLLMGVLRVIADDYGALALLEHTGTTRQGEGLSITLIEAEYAEGRSFDLGARVE